MNDTEQHRAATAAVAGGDVKTEFPLVRFIALLALLIVAMFPTVVAGTRTFVFRDFGIFGYPLAHFHREAFWRGEIPLMNPLNDFGLPFLAQWNTMTLYPGSLIYLLLPLSWSLGLFCVLHLFWAGLGMFFLARRWTGDGMAAAIAGTAFACNGLTLGSLMWPNNIAALGWMPWVIWCVERSWRNGGRSLLTAGIVGALQMLTGGPEIILQTWFIAGAFWVVALFRRERAIAPLLLRPLLVAAIVVALSAAQLFPFLDLLFHSHRDANFDSGKWSMPATGFANLLLPLFHAFRFPGGVHYQYDQQWVSSYYPGIGVLALGLLAAMQVRRREVWFLVGLILFSLLVALGPNGPIYTPLKNLIPALGWIRFPVKFVVIAIFGFPLLAAMAVTPTERATPLHWRSASTIWIALIGGLLALLWFAQAHPVYFLSHDEWMTLLRNALTRGVVLTATLALVLGLRHRELSNRRALLAVALVSTLWFDAVTHLPRQNPTIDREAYTRQFSTIRRPPITGFGRAMISPAANEELFHHLREDVSTDHLVHRLALVANCNLMDNVPKADGFFSLYLKEERPVRLLLYPGNHAVPDRLADFLAITHITKPGSLIEWQRRTNALPIITAGQYPSFAENAIVLQALTNVAFNPREEVYLPPEAAAEVKMTAPTTASILSYHPASERIDATVQAQEPSLVVVAQAFHHNWHATVDGNPTRIWRANHGFQALVVPAGRHEVVIQYQDQSFRWGAALSLVALLGVGGGYLLPRGRSAARGNDANPSVPLAA